MIRHVSWKSGRGSLYPQVRVQPLPSYVPPPAVSSTDGVYRRQTANGRGTGSKGDKTPSTQLSRGGHPC